MGYNYRITIILIYIGLQLAIIANGQSKIQSRGKIKFTPETSYYDDGTDSLESQSKFRPQYNNPKSGDELTLAADLNTARKSQVIDLPRVRSKFRMPPAYQNINVKEISSIPSTTTKSPSSKENKKTPLGDLQSKNNYASRRFDSIGQFAVNTNQKIHNLPLQKSQLEEHAIDKNDHQISIPPKQEKNGRRRVRQSSTTEIVKMRKQIEKRKSRSQNILQNNTRSVEQEKSSSAELSKTATTPKFKWRDIPNNRRVVKSMNSNIDSNDDIDFDQLEDENYPEHFKLLLKSKSKQFKIETSTKKIENVKKNTVTRAPQSLPQLLNKRVILPSRNSHIRSSSNNNLTTKNSTNLNSPIFPTNTTLPQKNEVQNDVKGGLNNLKNKIQNANNTRNKVRKNKTANTSNEISKRSRNFSEENQGRFSSKFTTENSIIAAKTKNLKEISNYDVSKLKNSYKPSLSKYSSRYRGPTLKLPLKQEKERDRPIYTPTVPPMTTESSSGYTWEWSINHPPFSGGIPLQNKEFPQYQTFPRAQPLQQPFTYHKMQMNIVKRSDNFDQRVSDSSNVFYPEKNLLVFKNYEKNQNILNQEMINKKLMKEKIQQHQQHRHKQNNFYASTQSSLPKTFMDTPNWNYYGITPTSKVTTTTTATITSAAIKEKKSNEFLKKYDDEFHRYNKRYRAYMRSRNHFI